MDWEDLEGEIQDIPNAHFDVLTSSLLRSMTRMLLTVLIRLAPRPLIHSFSWFRSREHHYRHSN